jgi:WD40 repeat protein
MNAPNQIISGGWDRQVRFWDVRANRMTASIGGKTSISGDSVDISQDNNYVVTGGGTLGEGVKLWDLR